jgi:hypothetical protein
MAKYGIRCDSVLMKLLVIDAAKSHLDNLKGDDDKEWKGEIMELERFLEINTVKE